MFCFFSCEDLAHETTRTGVYVVTGDYEGAEVVCFARKIFKAMPVHLTENIFQ